MCDDAQVAGGVLHEEEEEEEEIPLICKNSCRHKVSDIPIQALSALVSLQGLSILVLTKHWKRSSLKTFYQSLLKLTIPLSVQRSQMMVFCRMILPGKR